MAASRPNTEDLEQAPSAAKTPADMEREAVLIEMMLSGLDLRASAAQVGSPMLIYLVDLLVLRAHEELSALATY